MLLTTGQDKYTYHNEVNNFLRSEKVCCIGLTFHNVPAYPLNVAAKSVTGRRNPSNTTATLDAPSVFFYVAFNAKERKLMAWCYVLGSDSCSALCLALLHATMSMVAQAGHPKGWPVSVVAGIPTPVWAIAKLERRNSGDSIPQLYNGECLMASNQTQTRPYFTWLFLAIRRSDVRSKPHRCEVTAPDYLSARRIITRDHIASFAGRVPVRKA